MCNLPSHFSSAAQRWAGIFTNDALLLQDPVLKWPHTAQKRLFCWWSLDRYPGVPHTVLHLLVTWWCSKHLSLMSRYKSTRFFSSFRKHNQRGNPACQEHHMTALSKHCPGGISGKHEVWVTREAWQEETRSRRQPAGQPQAWPHSTQFPLLP